MRIFTDSKGVEWEISLNVFSIEKVLSKLGIDLYDPQSGDPPLSTKFCLVSAENITLFVQTIFTLCEEQAKERGVSLDQFGMSLTGWVIGSAYLAFFSEWQDFFLQLGRGDVAEMLKGQVEMIAEITEDTKRKVGEIKQHLRKEVLEKQSGKLQELLAFTQAPSP